MKVDEIMTPDVEIAAPEDTIQTAAQMMADSGVCVLPVCDGNRPVLDREKQLVGIVSLGDLALAGENREATAEAVSGIAQPAGGRAQ